MLTFALGGIALLVGGIGIMNMMLVSVRERTREIGIRKSVGADPRKVQAQFLIEALVLSALGGVAGVLAGIGVTRAISALAGWETIISLSALLAAFRSRWPSGSSSATTRLAAPRGSTRSQLCATSNGPQARRG